ncbi:MAG: AraC family transcriptional regulator [Alicyclobacillus herbarius]|uniref:AraC family transcriptional regulator n=1 Tax=Alicyclobacillus herbarius TaxID=122960 RepID=UPI0023578041|nr:AraC family transcriptional regulator [Alicyclobacillus herbarius]MCL6633646.1 AraC family transcriptional regulator [Alicyclobacillus herbarius]
MRTQATRLHFSAKVGMVVFDATVMKALPILSHYAHSVSGTDVSFTVHYWGVDQRHFDNPVHKHSFFEVCYVVDGQGTYRDGEAIYDLRAGDLFLSRPGVLHQIRSRSGLFLVFVAFEVNEEDSSSQWIKRFDSLCQTNRIFIRDAGYSPSILVWAAMLKEAAGYRSASPELTLQFAHTLLESFYFTFTELREGVALPVAPPVSNRIVRQAVRFIKDNLSQPLRMDEVASYLHVSQRHLTRLFASELGMNYASYVQRERIQYAQKLLLYTDLSIKSIAEEAGFSSVHYFTRVFKKEVGEPPGRYRAMNSIR